jgi:hypothetical protein
MKAHRTLTTLGATLAASAVLGSGALAADRPDDRAGMIGVGAAQVAVAPPDAVDRAILRPDNRSGMIGVGGAQAGVASPDLVERAVLRAERTGVPRSSAAAIAAPAVAGDDGLAWDDAALGATGVVVLVLGAGAAVTLRHRGRAVIR